MENWQDVLDVYYSDYDFINGGVDGYKFLWSFFFNEKMVFRNT